MSCRSPTAALAPSFTRPDRFPALRPITVTVCPLDSRSSVRGFETWPAAPVTTNFTNNLLFPGSTGARGAALQCPGFRCLGTFEHRKHSIGYKKAADDIGDGASHCNRAKDCRYSAGRTTGEHQRGNK